ncbi:MAG TPA: hypothetical protein VIK81_05170, partial [Patescibacteria group bacterium]
MKKDVFAGKIEKKIEILERFRNYPYCILSVYLGFPGKKTSSKSLVMSYFHSLIHRNLDSFEKRYFSKSLEKIEKYLSDSFDSRGKRSVAFFISKDQKLSEVLEFEYYLPPLCVISYSPYLNPVLESLEDYKKYMVLLVDRKKARMFTVHLGEIEEQKDIFVNNVPQRVKSGDDTWNSQGKIFRHIENHLHRHLKLVASKTSEFVKNDGVDFLIIGGHKEMFLKLKKHLEWPVNKMIVGEMVTELNIPINKIFQNSKKIASKTKG